MAAIIKECGYKLEQWRKPINRHLKRLEKQLDQTIKAKAIAKRAKKPEQDINKLTARIIRLENQMKASRDHIKSREVYAHTRNIFCMSFDGEQAETKAFDFLLWAAGARGWSMTVRSDDADSINAYTQAGAVARKAYAPQYQRHQERRAYWQGMRNDPLAPHNRDVPTEQQLTSQLSAWMAELECYEQLQIAV
ncbi:hypothetical protein [Photobacterium sp. TY1-4]|uniref:hypothetical protein n=1 Tax=Photobacterium sp. TY1-4 TaxID=2899122 RepID=UPI0021BFBFE7|nr:hypothetical protein [Photobacterium sp. TY1-4]UXI04102.1 hypothetical protein NH461_18505 [Photobacterium sp. TY1-4]